MAGRDVTIRYVGDSASAERAAARVRAANEKMSSGFANVSKSASDNFRKVGRSLTSAGRSITMFATLPIAGGFGLAIKAASDFNEQASKMKTVFGDFAPTIEAFGATSAKNIGLSKKAAFEATGTFGNMFNQLGFGAKETAKFSTTLTTAAADLASFHNADISQVIEAQTAAFRGEYDSLQRFIPTINAAAVQTEAMRVTGKKNAAELTAGEKAAATYTLMMQGMGKAQGDFARTSEGAANKQRILTARFQDLAVSIGQQILPIAVQFGEILATLLDKFNKLSPNVRKFILIGLGLVAVLGPIVGAVGALATVIGLVIAPVGLVILGLAALAVGLIYAYKHSETFRNIIQGVVDWFKGTAIPAVQNFAASFMETFRGIGEAITHVMNVIRDIINVTIKIISVAWDLFGQTILGYVKSVWTTIWGVIGGYLKVISGIIKTVLAIINGDWGRAWDGIKQIVAGIWQAIWGVINGFLILIKALIANAWALIKAGASLAWTGIKNAIGAAWEGIKSLANTAATWVKTTVGKIWDSISTKTGKVWNAIKGGVSSAWEGIKGVVRGGVNSVISIINGLIGGVNWVLDKLGIPKIGTISKLSTSKRPSASPGGARPMASGGVVPIGRTGPFVTNRPTAVVGEGGPHPEFVIPTDPKFRGRALNLFGQLGSKLVPGLAFGGVLGGIGDAFKGGFNWAKDKLGSVTGTVFRKALELGFAPFNTIAKAGLNALPNPLGVRDIAQGLRETLWQWVKGADSALPAADVGGGTGRGAGFGGLQPAFAAQIRQLISLYGGHLVSGWRSGASQRALYAAYAARGFAPPRVARPGTSMHERGLAADMSRPYGPLSRFAHQLGLKAPVPGEPWHWQPGWTTSRSLYARGGIVGYQHGGMVGRDGLGYLHRGEEVVPANKTRATTVINVHVDGSVISERGLVDALNRQLDRGARLGKNGRYR